MSSQSVAMGAMGMPMGTAMGHVARQPVQPAPLPDVPAVPADYHWLLRLPPPFWSHMHEHLDYHEILNLSLLSTQFRAVQVENYLPWSVRYAAVSSRDSRPAAISSRPGQSQTCGCYLCFRIKPIGAFQRHTDLFEFARVVRRDFYTGRRTFEPVAGPPPSSDGNVVEPPRMPSSPGASSLAMSVAMGAMDGMGGYATMGADMANMGGMGGIGLGGMGMGLLSPCMASPRVPVALTPRSVWMPRAPGADPGCIESLRRYCMDCALASGLLVQSDVTTTQAGKRLWVCRCPRLWPDAVRRCTVCNMNQVFRD